MLDFKGRILRTLLVLLMTSVPAFSATTPDCSITMQIEPVDTPQNCLAIGELINGQDYQIPTMECALQLIDISNSLANESGKVCIHFTAGEHAITYSNRTIFSDLFISGNGRDEVFLSCSDEDSSSLEGYEEFPMHVSGQATVEIQEITFRGCARPLLFNGTESVTLKDCTFSGFTESAIEIYNTPFIAVTNCSFMNNTSNGISPNSNSGNAGALSIGFNETFGPSKYQPQILIQDSDFVGNVATDERQCDGTREVFFTLLSKNYVSRGGAIAGYFAATDVFTSVLVERCLFIDNKADHAGAAAYITFSGSGDSHADITFRKCTFTRNIAQALSGGVQFTSETVLPNHIAFEDCVFEGNKAGLGGAIAAAHFHTQGNLNRLRLIRTNFTHNRAIVGAAIHIQSPFISILSYESTQTDSSRANIEDCSFTENVGKDIVFVSHNHLNFSGSNLFARNSGSSIRAEGSLLSFSGEALFEGNTIHPEGTSGALYLSSYGQLLLNENTHISFVDNTGRNGAAIVVSLPLISITFAKTLYNSQCFLQFADHTVPPIDWINHNVSLEFSGNQAHIGPVLFVTTLDACTWFNNSGEYFNPNISETWSFMRARENYVISKGVMVDNPDQYIQTEVKTINITPIQPDTRCGEDIHADVCAYPGQDIQLKVVALDEEPFMQQTTAFLRIMPDTDNTDFTPPIVQTNILSDVIYVSYNSSDSETFTNTTVFVEASFSASRASRANFTIYHLECLPGFELDEESEVCKCALERREVLSCDPNMEFVLLKNGFWGASPQWSRSLVSYTCPPGYCNCTGSPKSTVGCALVYSNPNFTCKPEREGVLCGQCKEPYGVGMLTMECQKFTASFSMYYWLMPLLIIFIIVSVVVIVKAGVAIPSVLLGFLFYVQITAIAVTYIDEHFKLVPAVMDCFHSFFALYVPYNFALHRGLTALEAYGLKFIPSVLVLILAPIVMRIKYHSKSWRGVWTLVLLMYAMTVQTSASLLFCPTFTRNMNGTTESITVWFFDGSVTCYQGVHLALAIVAVIFLILTGLFIPMSMGIVFQKELSKKITFFDRRHFEEISKAFTDSYKEVHRWWFPFELIRRFVLITMLIFWPGYMTLYVSLIGGVLVIQWFIQPYKHWWTNLAEAFSVLVLTVVMFFGDTNSFVIHATGTKNFALFPLLYFPLVIAVVCFFALVGWKIWYGARLFWRKRIAALALAEKGRRRSSIVTRHIYKRMSTQIVSINDCEDDHDGTTMHTMSTSGTVS